MHLSDIISEYERRIEQFYQIEQTRLNSFMNAVKAVKKGKQILSVLDDNDTRKSPLEYSVFLLRRKIREHATEIRVARVAAAQLSTERDYRIKKEEEGEIFGSAGKALKNSWEYLDDYKLDSKDQRKKMKSTRLSQLLRKEGYDENAIGKILGSEDPIEALSLRRIYSFAI